MELNAATHEHGEKVREKMNLDRILAIEPKEKQTNTSLRNSFLAPHKEAWNMIKFKMRESLAMTLAGLSESDNEGSSRAHKSTMPKRTEQTQNDFEE